MGSGQERTGRVRSFLWIKVQAVTFFGIGNKTLSAFRIRNQIQESELGVQKNGIRDEKICLVFHVFLDRERSSFYPQSHARRANIIIQIDVNHSILGSRALYYP